MRQRVMGRSYDRKHAEEILRRALQDNGNSDGIAHEDLVAAAAEVGIAAEAIERAAAAVEHDAERVQLTVVAGGRMRRAFYRRAASYGVLGGGMWLLNSVLGGELWAHWVAAGLGIALLWRGVRTFMPSEASMERAIAREEQRQRRLAQRRARRARRLAERDQSKRREADFERVVGRGVDALLRAAERKLDNLESSSQKRVRVEEPDDLGEDRAPDQGRRRHPD